MTALLVRTVTMDEIEPIITPELFKSNPQPTQEVIRCPATKHDARISTGERLTLKVEFHQLLNELMHHKTRVTRLQSFHNQG